MATDSTGVNSIQLPVLPPHYRSPHHRPPSHRHAIPSGPWPWIDIGMPVPDSEYDKPSVRDWPGYPQNLYQNWLPAQVERAQIKQAIDEPWDKPCKIYSMGVKSDGQFTKDILQEYTPKNQLNLWEYLQDEHEDIRLRCLFVDSMSGPVLQMLGTKYNIEPFFFSSALNWIPARYQEQAKDGEGDHITISLTFIRATHDDQPHPIERNESAPKINVRDGLILRHPNKHQASRKRLITDVLAIHMVRSPKNSTLITYHPPRGTDAKTLHDRVYYAGASVYWNRLYTQAADPTFVLLAALWYALYAWDQAFEILYEHICFLEETVIDQNDFKLTQELHLIRAHLLHYVSLLDNFKKSAEFVRNTPNCAMESMEHTANMETSKKLLNKECDILIDQITRLEQDREMQELRLRNVMNLVFSHINIQETKVAVRDSAIMKQIAFLTMVFLPATCIAGVFGMNVSEINNSRTPIYLYIGITIPLTMFTIWIVIAVQAKYLTNKPDEVTVCSQLSWPLTSTRNLIRKYRNSTRPALL